MGWLEDYLAASTASSNALMASFSGGTAAPTQAAPPGVNAPQPPGPAGGAVKPKPKPGAHRLLTKGLLDVNLPGGLNLRGKVQRLQDAALLSGKRKGDPYARFLQTLPSGDQRVIRVAGTGSDRDVGVSRVRSTGRAQRLADQVEAAQRIREHMHQGGQDERLATRIEHAFDPKFRARQNAGDEEDRHDAQIQLAGQGQPRGLDPESVQDMQVAGLRQFDRENRNRGLAAQQFGRSQRAIGGGPDDTGPSDADVARLLRARLADRRRRGLLARTL